MQEMMQFIDNSLTSYHAVCEVEKQLKNRLNLYIFFKVMLQLTLIEKYTKKI